MEMVLMGLAGCSSMDLLLILGKQRQNPEDIEVTVKGTRVDAVPAVYSDIHMHFEVSGEVSEKKLQKSSVPFNEAPSIISKNGMSLVLRDPFDNVLEIIEV